MNMIQCFLVILLLHFSSIAYGEANESQAFNMTEEVNDSTDFELQSNRFHRDRAQEFESVVKRTLKSSSSDSCDWKSNPLSFVRGELCGSYYKILGLDRKRDIIDKSKIKKLHRRLSLAVHPDKNPSEDAEVAFNFVQSAYECLSDPNCKTDYDNQLAMGEQRIQLDRKRIKDRVVTNVLIGMNRAHYYISMAAEQIFKAGMDIWDLAGDFQVTMFNENWAFGRLLLMTGLLWKGKIFLRLHLLAWLVKRINYEIEKAQIYDDSAFAL